MISIVTKLKFSLQEKEKEKKDLLMRDLYDHIESHDFSPQSNMPGHHCQNFYFNQNPYSDCESNPGVMMNLDIFVPEISNLGRNRD